jgi:hypothetical protein
MARNLGRILGRTLFVLEGAIPELEASTLKSFVVIFNDRRHLGNIHLGGRANMPKNAILKIL